MRHFLLLHIVLLLVIASFGHAQQQSRRGGPPPAPAVPEGTKAWRDLAYVKDGHERQKLDLFVPEKADGPLPLLIWVHGGGWQNGSKEGCPPLRNGYTTRGYAVASLNYRLSGHAVFPAQIEDCKAAIRWLRAHAKEYNLDPERFGVWGSSAGGHLVALLGTSGEVKEFEAGANLDQSSRVQAVCDYYGPTDFTVFVTTPGYESHAGDSSPEAKLIGGAVMQNKDKAARLNPITYVSKDDPPFLIVHGDQDRTVPLNQSQLLFDALRTAGASVHFHTIRGAGHGQGFGGPEIEAMVGAFFEAQLKSKTPAEVEAKTSESSASGGPTQRPGAPPARTDRTRGANTNPEDIAKNFKLEGESWTYRDGEFQMSGILLMPQGKAPFPAVLISHGLGGSAESFGMNKAREMVQWGYACIAPNYTHNTRAVGPMAKGGPKRAPNPDFGSSAENLRRAKTCVEILRSMPEVDGKRVCAYGHSMGGFVTIGLAAAEPDLLKAAAITGSGVAPREGFPAPSESAAEKIRTPFLMLHGADDTTVRPEQSEALKRVLDKNKVSNDRLVADGQGHPIDQTMRDEVFRLMKEWLLKWVGEGRRH
jgi:acetyl esterase/lipase